MFEDITFETILQRMLDRIPEALDKREGSIIYDALAPAAAELSNLYIEADTLLNETFADTASREYLILRAAERGLSPHEATAAVMKATSDPLNIAIPNDTRFNLGEYNYIVIGHELDEQGNSIEGHYMLEAEQTGALPSYERGRMIPIDYVKGLISLTITDCATLGEDEEDTEDFRNRYFDSLESQASGGNVAWYKQTVNEIDGVGGVKVHRAGETADLKGGQVKLVIVDSDYKVPSTNDLKNSIQTVIDPVQNHAEGLGFAPIGHTVTVEYATYLTVDIATTITYASGWDWSELEPYVNATVDAYFIELSKEWEDISNIIVRISQIESRLLDLDGVVDIQDTKLNNTTNNLVLGTDSIPKRGAITSD